MEYGQSYGKGQQFIMASFILAVLSLFTIQFVILPFVFGGLSILFALLSRGCLTQLAERGKAAIVISSVSMTITALIAVIAFQILFMDPAWRKQLNDYSTQIYGQSFDDLFQEAFDVELPDISNN